MIPSYGRDNPSAFGLTRIGGALGIAGCCIALFAFLLGCFGFLAAFAFSPLPLLMGLGGLVCTIIGAVIEPGETATDHPHVLASLSINIFALSAGAFLFALWRHWPLLHG